MPWDIGRQFKDPNQRKIFGGFLDEYTLLNLYRLSNKGYIKILYGTIKQGKESNVLIAEGQDKKKVAVKVYAIGASNFNRMEQYLIGDPRFSKIKRDKKSVVLAWCKKEFRNLSIATEAGVSCPKPIAFFNNVLVMEFIGEGFTAAPRLTDIKPENPENFLEETVENLQILYKKARLVHADLSEYNILVWNDKPVIIDFSQAVLLEHPNSDMFLRKGIRNIDRFFRKFGVKTSEREIYEKITGKSF